MIPDDFVFTLMLYGKIIRCSQNALIIKRGGGTGPLKPRQPQ